MNITSKGARRTLSAVCSAAVVAAGSAFFVSPASAAGVTLAYGPTATSATITDLDVTGTLAKAEAAYGLKVTGVTDSDPLRVAVLTGPSSGAVQVERVAGNGTPTQTATSGTQLNTGAANITTGAAASAGATTVTLSGANASDITGHAIRFGASGPYAWVASGGAGTTLTLESPLSANVANTTAVYDITATPAGFYSTAVGASSRVYGYSSSTADNIYLGAAVPGTYTLQFYKDRNGNAVYDAAQDDAAPVFTLTVKDVTNATSSDTTDDLSPTLTVPASTDVGQAVTATVATGLTTVDTRGVNGSSVGVLGAKLAAASSIAFDGTYLPDTGASSFDGTSITETSGSPTAGTGSTVFTMGSITKSASTVVTNNTVTGVAEDVTNVTGSVMDATGASARNVYVKTGTPSATFTATTTLGGGATLVPNAKVFFTLTSSTPSTLSADGTLESSTSTTKVYSAMSNTSGVATLKVTSSVTTVGTTYTVSEKSNGVTADLLTVLYQDAAGKTFEVTTPSSGLYPAVGSSVMFAGKMLDQFGAAFQPAGSAAQDISLDVDINDGDGTWDFANFPAHPTLSGGAFSYTYTPSTTPTVGQLDIYRITYSGATTLYTDVKWTSPDAPSSLTITAPLSTATPNQKKGSATPGAGTQVTGTVLSSTNSAMAYKSVTLSGSEGVFFSDGSGTPSSASTTDDLAKTITVAADGSGTYSAYAFFGKAGAATIKVASGTATKTVDLVVTEQDDPYKVIAVDAAVLPGGTSVVTGEVKNAWGFPVAGTAVNLSLGTSTIATLGATVVTTNSDGVWSTTLTGASDADGKAMLTATLFTAGSTTILQTANLTPDSHWFDDAGVTLPTGAYQDTATIMVDANINKTVVKTATASGKTVTLRGTAKPGSTVEVYSKVTGSSQAFALVGVVSAMGDGTWADTEYINSTTTFFAKTSVSTSSTVTVSPKSTVGVSFSAKAIGSGKVKVTVNGSPNKKGTITVYVNGSKKGSMSSNAAGDGTMTVKAGKGSKTIKVTFSSSAGSASASKTVTVS